MSTKFRPHIHTVVGGKIIIVVSLVPPFVEVVAQPIAGLTKETEDSNYKGHEHEEISIPSAEISGSTQQLIGNIFTSHSHTKEVVGISLFPPGAFTAFITFLAPPIDATSDKLDEYLEYQKNHYLDYFNKNIRSKIIANGLNNNINYKDIIMNYSNLYGGKLYEKFKNNQ